MNQRWRSWPSPVNEPGQPQWLKLLPGAEVVRVASIGSDTVAVLTSSGDLFVGRSEPFGE